MTSTGPQAEPLLPDVAHGSFVSGATAGAGGGAPAGRGISVAEVRLGQGGRVVTRLVTPGPRDDGYCSSDSTPKGTGRCHADLTLLGLTPREPNIGETAETIPLHNPPSDSPPLAGHQPSDPLQQGDDEDGSDDQPDQMCGPGNQIQNLSPSKSPLTPLPPNQEDGRESWGKGMDFLLSIIGFAVDLANVWRFPFLCYRNGGGAFLLPYFLITAFGALPLFFMELVLGQYNRQGPITVWRICPLFRGVGYCAVLVAYFVSFYYNVIIAWAIHFVYASFSYELPWTNCNHTWNTPNCWDGLTSEGPRPNDTNMSSPSEEYFNLVVLQMDKSTGIDDLGPPQMGLILCGFITYLILYLSLFKGVKSSGKVVWVTATMPYVILTALLIRGSILPGASAGIIYYLKPSLSALLNYQVWFEAAVQVFFSVGAGFGVHLSYASYNHFSNNCYRDCLITSLVNAFTSFYSGLVIFTYLGFMAEKQQMHISTVATDGPGLVFQVYPEAVATLPFSQLWSILFFIMLIMLGLDSGMGGLECVITGLLDELRETFGRKVIRREVFTAIVVSSSFLVSIANFCQGGMYMFHWLDTYAAGLSLLSSALFESIGVVWFYGLDRFTSDIRHMLGFQPSMYWILCWKFISPLFILVTIILGIFFMATNRLEYHGLTLYVYPRWAEAVGWLITSSSLLMIPLWMIIVVARQKEKGICAKFAAAIVPLEKKNWMTSSTA